MISNWFYLFELYGCTVQIRRDCQERHNPKNPKNPKCTYIIKSLEDSGRLCASSSHRPERNPYGWSAVGSYMYDTYTATSYGPFPVVPESCPEPSVIGFYRRLFFSSRHREH